MIGTTLSHYRIVSKLGEGGMGEVYRARDERLDRDVAIKVLPEAVAQNPDRLARFEREAKAVAKLSHPNILEIFDYGREGDTTYAVTELLEGHSLREAIVVGPMPWKKAIDIGAAVADGLARAHDKNVIHRDIKPSNIFVCSDGRVKILDFGLASIEQAVDFDADTRSMEPPLTREGKVMGTVGYMSPEQARGRPVDHRSDIFSLGCVLYEMMSGKGPFDRGSSADTIAAILKEDPPPLSDTSSEPGPDYSSTIERCLEKEPERRFQSASDLAYNLRAISSGSAPALSGAAHRARRAVSPVPRFALAAAALVAMVISGLFWAPWREAPTPDPEIVPNRVAIAPLENRTGDPTLDSLGSMAADEIAHRFTETGAAELVPVSRAPGVEAVDNWAIQIARDRGAAFLLSGAYYLDADLLRLQVRLVHTPEGDLIYSFPPVETARGAPTEALETLGERILAAVAAHLYPQFDISVMSPPSTYEAFQTYRRGQESFGFDSAEAYRHAKRAIELDPRFAMAHGMAIHACNNLGKVDLAAEQISISEAFLDGYTTLEQTYHEYLKALIASEYERALVVSRQLLAAAPHFSTVRYEVAMVAMFVNRPRETAEALEPMLLSFAPRISAVSSWPLQMMTSAQHVLGDYEKELEYADAGCEHFPDSAKFFHARARALIAQGELEKAHQVIQDLLSINARDGSAGAAMSDTAMELRAHGHRSAGGEMAARSVEWFDAHPALNRGKSGATNRLAFMRALWMTDRLDRLEELIAQVELEGVIHAEAAAMRGWIAASRGDRGLAIQISDSLPAGNHPLSLHDDNLWRASIAAHLGEKQRAVVLLTEAFSKGSIHGLHLHTSPGFEPLWDYPPFQELIRPKG